MATKQTLFLLIIFNLLFASLANGIDDTPLLQTPPPTTDEQEAPLAIEFTSELLQVITPDQVKCSAKILDLEQYSDIIPTQNNDLDSLICSCVKTKSIPLVIEINNQSEKTISVDWERFSQSNYYSFFDPERTFLEIQLIEFTTTPLIFKLRQLMALASCECDTEGDSSFSIYVEMKTKNLLRKLRKEIAKRKEISLQTKRRPQILKPNQTTHSFYWFKRQPRELTIQCKFPAPWLQRTIERIVDAPF